jgi:hypothetical protein
MYRRVGEPILLTRDVRVRSKPHRSYRRDGKPLRRCTVKMRRIVHSLGWLAALVMAVSAGWKAW